MSFYPEKIGERFHAPKNIGETANTNAVGTNATVICGAFLRFSLLIDVQTKEILDAKFQTDGCGFTIAAADILAEIIVGKHLNELHDLDGKILQKEIENALGVFSDHRQHCLDLTFRTLQKAFADFRLRQIEEFAGEKALICTCFGVSEDTIENLVRNDFCETIEKVTGACNAGGGCGSCQPLIQEIIDAARLEEF